MKDVIKEQEVVKGRFCGAYVIEHLSSGKSYAGSSNDLLKRKSKHLSNLRLNRHECGPLQAAYNQDPNLKWRFWICPNIEFAKELEQNFIDELKEMERALNIAPRVEHPSLGLTRSPEWRRMISERNTGNQYLKGHRRTPEYVDAMKERLRGRTRDPEAVRATADKLRGRKQDPEHVEERSRIMKEKAFRRPVIIEGTTYPSIKEASDMLNIGRSTIAFRINSTTAQWKNYSYGDNRTP